MAGSMKGLFKRTVKNTFRPDRFFKQEIKQWEKRGKKFDMSPDAPAQDTGPVMPMADEEEIQRSKRRTTSARGGGRASTIFTESDRLGP